MKNLLLIALLSLTSVTCLAEETSSSCCKNRCAPIAHNTISSVDNELNTPCCRNQFVPVAKKAIPAVVFIKCQTSQDQDVSQFPGGDGSAPDEDLLYRFFFPQNPNQKQPPRLSQGSGFFVSADGYIMTNAHVVKGAEKILVILNDGRELDATLVGADPRTDVAVIKVDGKNFPFLQFGDSDKLEIAEEVMAIGSPFQLQASVTTGVISGKNRQKLGIADFENFIQTDAAINPGNSGGPLLNLHGEVIAINTAIVFQSSGTGFSIPSNLAKSIMIQLIDKGTVVRGFLGISLQPLDKDLADNFGLDKVEGALVAEVVKDSPADKAGLKAGDIIIEYNGVPVKSVESFRNEIAMTEPGKTVSLKVNRKGKVFTLPVTLGTASDNVKTAGGFTSKFGIEVENLTPDIAQQLGYTQGEMGVIITKIKPGSPAAMAGIRPGCLIVSINDKKTTNIDEFNTVLKDIGTNKRALLRVRCGTFLKYYSIKLD